MVDRIFIGRMPSGDLAMAGIGIVTLIVLLVTAFSSLVGFRESTSCYKNGAKRQRRCRRDFRNSFSLIIIIGLILTTVFFIFKEQIVMAFGGSSNTAQYAIDYFIYISYRNSICSNSCGNESIHKYSRVYKK